MVIDIAGNTGDTPLLFAIRRKNVEIARLLLENGADANRMDPNGVAMTPLQEACQMVCQDMIELLLVFGSNPNLFPLGKPENSPLAISSRNNALPAVKLLLDSGAKDVNDVACLQAIRSSYHHIVGVFLDSGRTIFFGNLMLDCVYVSLCLPSLCLMFHHVFVFHYVLCFIMSLCFIMALCFFISLFDQMDLLTIVYQKS